MSVRRDRIGSLDAFRGLTIAGMILVNTPGTWSHVYPPLLHAEWHGWTPTDLVFPFFLFIVGVAIPLSFRRYLADPDLGRGALYRRVLRRSALIFLVGLLLTGFPEFDLAEIRIPGVLQRIALVYLATSLLVLNVSARAQAWWAAGLLVLYQVLMTWVPVPGHGPGNLAPDANLAAWLDRLLLGQEHLWQNRPWDPEGLLSTVPAVSTCLVGVFAGRWLTSDRDRREIAGWMLAGGWLLILLGQLWGAWFPINKNLWTSSYVVFTAGMALEGLGVCYWLMDVSGYRSWARPAIVFGRNPLFIYVVSIFLAKVLLLVPAGAGPDGDPSSAYRWGYERLFASWLSPINASLAFALTVVALCWGLAWLLDRKDVYVRV